MNHRDVRFVITFFCPFLFLLRLSPQSHDLRLIIHNYVGMFCEIFDVREANCCYQQKVTWVVWHVASEGAAVRRMMMMILSHRQKEESGRKGTVTSEVAYGIHVVVVVFTLVDTSARSVGREEWFLSQRNGRTTRRRRMKEEKGMVLCK